MIENKLENLFDELFYELKERGYKDECRTHEINLWKTLDYAIYKADDMVWDDFLFDVVKFARIFRDIVDDYDTYELVVKFANDVEKELWGEW